MADLSKALEAIRGRGQQMSPSAPPLGTCWGRTNKLISRPVPNVPAVPFQNNAPHVPACTTISAFDVLERAAVLEYCEGLPRAEADARALAELTATFNAAIG